MIFQTLIEQIKTEARIKEDDEFDSTVIGLINEMFKEAVESQRPFELREETFLNLTTATNTVALPEDFFIHQEILFVDADTGREYQLTDQDEAISPAPRGMYGHPKSFEIVTGQLLNIKPFANIVTGDKIHLVYYKFPPVVTTETVIAENPIPRLEPYLIRTVIRRLRMFHIDDAQVAQMFSQDVASAAKGYSNDEPVRNPRLDTSRG